MIHTFSPKWKISSSVLRLCHVITTFFFLFLANLYLLFSIRRWHNNVNLVRTLENVIQRIYNIMIFSNAGWKAISADARSLYTLILIVIGFKFNTSTNPFTAAYSTRDTLGGYNNCTAEERYMLFQNVWKRLLPAGRARALAELWHEVQVRNINYSEGWRADGLQTVS